jgi:hypothetical protein
MQLFGRTSSPVAALKGVQIAADFSNSDKEAEESNQSICTVGQKETRQCSQHDDDKTELSVQRKKASVIQKELCRLLKRGLQRLWTYLSWISPTEGIKYVYGLGCPRRGKLT